MKTMTKDVLDLTKNTRESVERLVKEMGRSMICIKNNQVSRVVSGTEVELSKCRLVELPFELGTYILIPSDCEIMIDFTGENTDSEGVPEEGFIYTGDIQILLRSFQRIAPDIRRQDLPIYFRTRPDVAILNY